jgi:DNA-binding NtrC family response regulator
MSEPKPSFSILLVDDDLLMLRATARTLRHAGMKVVAVETAAAALEELKKDRFDVVLSDWNLRPPERGDRLFAEIEARFPASARLVLYSSHSFDAAQVPYRVLAKPFSVAELVAAVDEQS